MTRTVIAQKAFALAEVNNLPHPFRNTKAGYDWVSGFLKRHKDRLSIRTAQPICIERIYGFTRSAVYRFFDNLETVISMHGYERHQIYNVDETGFSIVQVSLILNVVFIQELKIYFAQSRAPRILAQRGSRLVATLKAAERGSLITVVACASASGRYIPPYFIFPGRRTQEQEEKVQLGPVDSESANSPKGWVTTDVFYQWLHHLVMHLQPSEDNRVGIMMRFP